MPIIDEHPPRHMKDQVHDRWTKAAFTVAVGLTIAFIGGAMVWIDLTFRPRQQLGVIGMGLSLSALTLTWLRVAELKPWA